MKMPSKEIPVNMERKLQSISMVSASPRKNPSKDLKAIIIKDVPMATFMSMLAKITSAGMIRNPPPAPIIPVTPPTSKPSIKIKAYL